KMKTDTLRKFSRALKRIDIEKLFLEAVSETSELAILLNQDQMNKQGVRADGSKIGTYTPEGKKHKAAKGQTSSHITLRDKGNFQDDIFIDARKLPILIDSADWKSRILQAVHGEVLGLTKDNRDAYRKVVVDLCTKKYKAKIDAAKSKAI